MQNNQEDHTKFIVGFAVGLAAGWWLNSEEGKAFRKDSSDKINKFGATVSDRATNISQKTSEQFDTVSKQVKSSLAQGRNYATDFVNNMKKKVRMTGKTIDLQEEGEKFSEGL